MVDLVCRNIERILLHSLGTYFDKEKFPPLSCIVHKKSDDRNFVHLVLASHAQNSCLCRHFEWTWYHFEEFEISAESMRDRTWLSLGLPGVQAMHPEPSKLWQIPPLVTTIIYFRCQHFLGYLTKTFDSQPPTSLSWHQESFSCVEADWKVDCLCDDACIIGWSRGRGRSNAFWMLAPRII